MPAVHYFLMTEMLMSPLHNHPSVDSRCQGRRRFAAVHDPNVRAQSSERVTLVQEPCASDMQADDDTMANDDEEEEDDDDDPLMQVRSRAVLV